MNAVYFIRLKHATEEQRAEFDAAAGLVDTTSIMEDERLPEELRGRAVPAHWLAAKE